MTGRTGASGLGLGLDPDPLFADLIDAVRCAARELELDPVDVRVPADAAGLESLLLVGRPGRHRDLLAMGRDLAPRRVVWTGEPLPSAPGRGAPARPVSQRPLRRLIRPIGAGLRRLPLPASFDRRRVAVASQRLTRANLDELAMAAANGARLVVTSRDRAALLATHGLAAAVIPFGYHERHAGPMTRPAAGPRDLPLLVLGSRASHTRRARLVDDLYRRGADAGLQVVDGAWGTERDALLRRTRVVVDIHRIPGNFIGLRLLLSLAAGAALVTEPMTDPAPFIPGVHFLEAPGTQLLEVASALAADELRRARLVDAGQAFLREQLTMRASLERVLAARAT